MSARLEALTQQGAAHIEDTNFAAARAVFAEVVRLAEIDSGPDSPELVDALMWLAKATGDNQHSPCNELEQQVTLQRRALAIANNAFRQDDIRLAHCFYTHALTLWASGRRDEALAAGKRAIDILAATAADDRFYSRWMVAMLLDAGLPHEALPYARRSLGVLGGEEPDVVGLYRLGRCLREAGAKDEAREVLQRFLVAFADGDEETRSRVADWIRDLG